MCGACSDTAKENDHSRPFEAESSVPIKVRAFVTASGVRCVGGRCGVCVVHWGQSCEEVTFALKVVACTARASLVPCHVLVVVVVVERGGTPASVEKRGERWRDPVRGGVGLCGTHCSRGRGGRGPSHKYL